MIIDTNVLIYLSKYTLSPEKILVKNAAISVITKIEALGFKFSNDAEYELISGICNELKAFSLSDEIADATINIRKNHKIKLADALIYATALVEGLPLLTNNIKDFNSLSGDVKLINPFDL